MARMILVTGAGGKTGKAIIKALVARRRARCAPSSEAQRMRRP